MAAIDRDPMLRSRYFVSDQPTRDALWEALEVEPNTGVAIVTLEGFMVYCNDAMARLLHGPNAQGKHYTGVPWQDLYPEEWVRERLSMLKQVEETGEPLMVRGIWRGRQTLSMVRKLSGGKAGHFLVISKALPKIDGNDLAPGSKIKIVEANVVNLGPLETLSSRELEVLALIGQGLSLKEIAAILQRSIKTVEKHRQAVGRKLQAEDRVKLAKIAHEAGLTLRDAKRSQVKPKR